MEETKKVDIQDAGIDKEVLEEIAKENILDSLTDDKQIKRVEINFYCELLAQLNHLDDSMNNLVNIFTICSNKQITEFFFGVKKKMKEEQMARNVEKIVEKSHKRSKKSKKSVE